MTLWLQNYHKTSSLLFIHSALCSPCHCFLSILFSTSLPRNLFRFIYSRHSNLRYDLSVSAYQQIVTLNYFTSGLISSCISQDTPREVCFHWLNTLFKNICTYYMSRVKKAYRNRRNLEKLYHAFCLPPDAYCQTSRLWASEHFLNRILQFP